MNSTAEAIRALKKRLGPAVCIAGHHYQAQNVIDHCDITGDSLELARKVADITAPHIVFCGVYFMAESAALLARTGQHVYLPETAANCVMAQMTPSTLVSTVLQRLSAIGHARGHTVLPLAYVNTSLAVKAVVGRMSGAVCTSANAHTMLRWALDRADKVLFLPDRHLARNTALRLGLTEADWHVLDVRRKGEAVALDAASSARLYIWPGCCAIHAKFKTEHIAEARAAYPGCRVAVHPECSPDVVNAADVVGSTASLIHHAHTAAPASTLVIGTETNLVERLREECTHCTIIRLRRAFCSHMAKITEAKLHATLEAIGAGTATPVRVPKNHMSPARASLMRMLDICDTMPKAG